MKNKENAKNMFDSHFFVLKTRKTHKTPISKNKNGFERIPKPCSLCFHEQFSKHELYKSIFSYRNTEIF